MLCASTPPPPQKTQEPRPWKTHIVCTYLHTQRKGDATHRGGDGDFVEELHLLVELLVAEDQPPVGAEGCRGVCVWGGGGDEEDVGRWGGVGAFVCVLIGLRSEELWWWMGLGWHARDSSTLHTRHRCWVGDGPNANTHLSTHTRFPTYLLPPLPLLKEEAAEAAETLWRASAQRVSA
jgi:hypothetical protein